MSRKFQNKYRVDTVRLQNWDYRWKGAYFITACTKNRSHYFGEVVNGKMELSNAGVLADIFWREITNHTKNVTLGEFIVMPNHIHGVLILKDWFIEEKGKEKEKISDSGSNPDPIVEPLHATAQRSGNTGNTRNSELPNLSLSNLSNDQAKSEYMAKISPKANSISTIIRSYKSAVTKHANRLGLDFEWQPSFYDNVIRDDKAFTNISNYIRNNPRKWGEDKFYEKE